MTIGAEAQNVTNADFAVVGDNIEVYYTLDAVADIDIFCSTDGGKSFGKPLRTVSGDVGENVMPGNKKAVWHVYADREMLYAKSVLFKIRVRESKKTFDVNGVLVEMMKVNGGSFIMGVDVPKKENVVQDNFEEEFSQENTDSIFDAYSTANDTLSSEYEEYDYDEGEETRNDTPAHGVVVSEFYIGRKEVTVELFKQFVDATGYVTDAERIGGSYIAGNGGWVLCKGVTWRCGVDGRLLDESDYDHAVIHVSWNDAVAFCTWLKQVTGEPFRLPSEAEWEYAARGGDESMGYEFSGSDDIYDVAWYWSNSCQDGPEDLDYGVHRGGERIANELGVYDMTGNVAEWCNDIFGSYLGGSQMNPMGEVEGAFRVLRGGSWYDMEEKCGMSSRVSLMPQTRRFNIGFRLAL